MTFNRRQLKSLAQTCPENLILVRNKDLMDLHRSETCDEQLQGNCLAELYARWFVADSDKVKDVERFLSGATPGGIPPQLLYLRTSQDMLLDEDVREAFASPLWQTDDPADCYVEQTVRERLRQLMTQTDGFVPVYGVMGAEEGLFIPFEIVPRLGRAPSAIDQGGKTIGNWNRPAREILGSTWQMRVRYRQGTDRPALSGRSFLLPLQVALWKKEGKVPDFNPWQLLFTGDIDLGRRAVAVRTDEKLAGVKAMFQESVKLVAPSDSPYADEIQGIDPIPVGYGGERLLNAVRARIEKMPGCCLSLDYVEKRLPTLEHEIRQETIGAWEGQIARVDAMLGIMGKYGAPQRHLQLLMLKSAAYCHSGRTGLALKENVRALAFAREKGLVYQALRLEIEQLVEFQDSQRFDDIAKLATTLLSRIRKAGIAENERVDLLMRYHGTIGQIQMEEGLLGLKGRAPTLAQKNLEQAREYACRLNSPADQLQDLNYLYLWYALFDSANEAMRELESEIDHRLRSLESEEERVKNSAYVRRQKMVAYYMKWRLTGECASGWKVVKDIPAGSEPWLTASFMRMKGALASAAGDRVTAQSCFAAGEAQFPTRSWWKSEGDVLSCGPVFAQIRLALLTQAHSSLAALGLSAEADVYREKALTLLSECPSVLRRVGAADCQKMLHAHHSPNPRSLPLFYY